MKQIWKILKMIPFLAQLAEKYLDKKIAEIPMEEKKLEINEPVLIEKAKGKVLDEQNRNDRKEHRNEDKAERRDLKDEHGRFPRIKEKRKNKGEKD